MVNIGNDWDGILAAEFESGNYKKIREFLKTEYREYTVYPDMHNIFNAFKFTPYRDTKIVLLGQDPYHGPGQAEGLCFSVPNGVDFPPSLQNIFKELKADIGLSAASGCLKPWAERGMLLLNSTLTVRAGQANSHRASGWELFTDNVIKLIDQKNEPVVFMLWGAYAKSKKELIQNRRHLILEAAQPSPLSAYNGFFGCRHFSKARDFVAEHYGIEFDFLL